MKQNKEVVFLVKKLGCANCASKIEQGLQRESKFISASLNYMNATVTISYDPNIFASEHEVMKLANQYVKKYEHDAYLVEKVGYTSSKSSNSTNKEEHVHNHGCNCGHDHSAHDHDHSHTHDHATPEFGHSHNHGDHDDQSFVKTALPWVIGTLISGLAIAFMKPGIAQLVVIILGYVILGYKVIRSSIYNIMHGSLFDENFLLIVATIGALYIKEYPEAIAVLLLFQIGEYLQDLAVDRSKKHLSEAMNLKPQFATIETKAGLTNVAPEEVSVGDILVVKPSEKIALDGIVIEGTSFLDTSSLTGESVPRKVTVNEEVLSGCINGEATIKIKVTKPYTESTIAKVLDLVQNASNRKSLTENFITKFAKIYTPVVVLLAVLIAILPPIVTKSMDFSTWIYTACGFLVVSCPCALVISVPLGFFAGIGKASKNGIIVKGSNYLEALNQVTTVVFDKTGTLTKGTFEVKEVTTLGGLSKEQFLYTAALLESFSTHPIASSIVNYYKAQYHSELPTSAVMRYKEIAGHGVQATIHDQPYYLGNLRFMKSIKVANIPNEIDTIGTIAYLANKTTCLGYIIISDEIKADALEAMNGLKEMGIQTVLLTGDTKKVANKVASSLNISTVYAELLPTDKVTKLEELMDAKSDKENIAFVGDGINDAPVIARADIGFAMGGVGSDAAIEAADIVLMTDEPEKILKSISIAKFTKQIVTMNIIMSLGIKVIVLLVLAFGYGTMWLAIFADVGVSLLAILNSIRVLSTKRL